MGECNQDEVQFYKAGIVSGGDGANEEYAGVISKPDCWTLETRAYRGGQKL